MARVKDTGPNPESAMLPVAGKGTARASRAKSAAMNSTQAPAKESTNVKKNDKVDDDTEMGNTTEVKKADATKTTGGAKAGKSVKSTKADIKKSVAAYVDDKSVEKQGTKGKKTKAVEAVKPIKATAKKIIKDIKATGEEVSTNMKAKISKAKEEVKKGSNKNGKRTSDAIADDDDNVVINKAKKAKVQATAVEKPKKAPVKAPKTAKKTSTTTKKASTASKDTTTTNASAATSKSTEAKTTRSKKRKQSDDEDSADGSSDSGIVKKLKTSVKQGGADILNKVQATIDTVTDVVTGGQTSILDDIANSAKEATDSASNTTKSSQKGKKSAKSALEPTTAEIKAIEAGNDSIADVVSTEDGEHWVPEEEIADLITGFESAGEDEESGDEGFKQGKAIPKLPTQKSLTLTEQTENKSDGPGVIYIGRIPHGFHEHEMRAYFSQFGDINHVRLSRSKKTGRSKHYAFLEFKSEEVAKIAAKTMDNYLLFGHILKCSFVNQKQIHASLWNGADRRFKTVPWAKIAGRKLEAPKGRTEWAKKVEKESSHRAAHADKLKEIGYDYNPVDLMDVDSVSVQAPKEVLENVIIQEGIKTVQEDKIVTLVKEGNFIMVNEEVKSKKVKVIKEVVKTIGDAASSIGSRSSSSSEEGKRVRQPSKRALEAAETAEAFPEMNKGKRLRKK